MRASSSFLSCLAVTAICPWSTNSPWNSISTTLLGPRLRRRAPATPIGSRATDNSDCTGLAYATNAAVATDRRVIGKR